MWEGILQFATDIFKNNKADDQVGARVPFAGTIQDPKAGLIQTMVSVFHNAFVGAFAHSLEGSISLRDVKKNLSEVGDDPKEKNAKGEGKSKADSSHKEDSHEQSKRG
jgi:hypothetical protein